MSKPEIPIVKRSLFSWIFAGNLKLQLLLTLIILGMVFVRVVPLDMQKRIVNEAINLRDLDKLLLYSGYYLAAVFFFQCTQIPDQYHSDPYHSAHHRPHAQRPVPSHPDVATQFFQKNPTRNCGQCAEYRINAAR